MQTLDATHPDPDEPDRDDARAQAFASDTQAADTGSSSAASSSSFSSTPSSSESHERVVPVSEAIRYRKRAQSAEQALADLQSQLNEAQQRCTSAEQTIDRLERRQRIDALLSEADAIDVEAARLLTEAAVQSMDEPDLAEAVQDLRRHKPYLFERRGEDASGLALSPRIEGIENPLAHAAQQAQHSGDRRDLLRYLRLRRRP